MSWLAAYNRQNQQYKIRLNGIDSPESGQPFGQAAKRNLSGLVYQQDVVVWRKTDRYGRIVGKVTIGNTNANLEQLRAGMAWYFRQYESDVSPEDRSLYDQAEREARSGRRGLWQQPNPQPPWEYRAQERGGSASGSSGSAPSFPGRGAGQIVGNRNSMIYHRPDCPDYDRVSERNRVYFVSEREAENAGFRKARNCP